MVIPYFYKGEGGCKEARRGGVGEDITGNMPAANLKLEKDNGIHGLIHESLSY